VCVWEGAEYVMTYRFLLTFFLGKIVNIVKTLNTIALVSSSSHVVNPLKSVCDER